tara:strand:+ start:26505 stop:26789 length:285 start_codon:yes stop_codon:yes gene_type:complete
MADINRTHEGEGGGRPTRNTIRVLNRHVPMPATRPGRIALGSALVIGGALGFLPVVGFWMLPLGLLVLAQDVPRIRRWRRNLVVRWERRRRKGR